MRPACSVLLCCPQSGGAVLSWRQKCPCCSALLELSPKDASAGRHGSTPIETGGTVRLCYLWGWGRAGWPLCCRLLGGWLGTKHEASTALCLHSFLRLSDKLLLGHIWVGWHQRCGSGGWLGTRVPGTSKHSPDGFALLAAPFGWWQAAFGVRLRRLALLLQTRRVATTRQK